MLLCGILRHCLHSILKMIIYFHFDHSVFFYVITIIQFSIEGKNILALYTFKKKNTERLKIKYEISLIAFFFFGNYVKEVVRITSECYFHHN